MFTITAVSVKIRHLCYTEKLQREVSRQEVWSDIIADFRSQDYWDIVCQNYEYWFRFLQVTSLLRHGVAVSHAVHNLMYNNSNCFMAHFTGQRSELVPGTIRHLQPHCQYFSPNTHNYFYHTTLCASTVPAVGRYLSICLSRLCIASKQLQDIVKLLSRPSSPIILLRESRKGHSTLPHNLAKYWSTFKILSPADSAVTV